MRNFTKILLALALTVVCVGGANSKTIKRCLRLTDSNLNTSFWKDHTVNPVDGSVLNESEGDNSSIAWMFSPVLDASSYTSLVVKLKSGAPAELKIRLYDGGGFWDGDNVRTSSSIAAGGTSVTIDLTTIKKGDNSPLSLNSLNYVEIHNSSFTTTTYYVDEIYFAKEVDGSYKDFTTDPFDINNLTFSDGITLDLETQTINFSVDSWSNSASWFYSPAQDWSGYHYFVMVPQKQWNSDDCPNRIKIDTYYNSGSGDTGADIDCWYQTWAKRANIVDIETKLPDPKNNVTRLSIFSPDQAGSFKFSAFYLSNTRPTSDGDYVRAIAAADTWGTLCLPYHFALCGAVAYDVVGVDSKDSPTKLYLEPKFGVLEAGKAYLFKTNSTDGLRAYRVSEEEAGSPVAGNLNGTFVGATVPNDGTSYILSGGVWKRVNGTTNTVGANRAYLTLTDELVVPAAETSRYLEMGFDGNGTTGISTMQNSECIERNEFYDLSGRRVAQPSKGLYIVNGKKVIIK